VSRTHPIVLITGATSGIGRHAALHLARRGFRVIATGRRQDALNELRDQATLETLILDVTCADSIADGVADVERLTGGYGIDVLVNNAGYGSVGPLIEMPDADVRGQFDTNVFGLLAVTRAFAPAMQRRGSGRVLNISSLGGKVTFPLMGAYTATKYAVESMSDALRMELAPFGVHVVLIEPGLIRSRFFDTATTGLPTYTRPDSAYRAVLARSASLRRLADLPAVGPECVSHAIERAIVARRPAERYMAPLRTKLVLLLLRAFPTRVTDYALGKAMGMSRASAELDQMPGDDAPSSL